MNQKSSKKIQILNFLNKRIKIKIKNKDKILIKNSKETRLNNNLINKNQNLRIIWLKWKRINNFKYKNPLRKIKTRKQILQKMTHKISKKNQLLLSKKFHPLQQIKLIKFSKI